MTEPRRAARLALVALLSLGAAPALAAGPTVAVSGSFYVDEALIPQGGTRTHATQGMTPDGSLKIGLDINDDLSFSAKACLSCHGIEMEHAAIDYQPRTWFNVQVGRLAVPFGEYSNRIDQSGHRTVSAPLIYDMGRMAYGGRADFNGPILMLPYVDTGALVYGQIFLGSAAQLWYGAYLVGGLKGSADVDWIALRSVPYTDNNRVPAWGGRLALTLTREPGGLLGDLSVGLSYTGGRFDKAGRLQYNAGAVDVAIPFWRATLRAEAAFRRTQLDPSAAGYAYVVIDDYFDKRGGYVELEHPAGRYLVMVYRYDRLDRVGVPLPGSSAEMRPRTSLERATAGAVVTPAPSVFVKLGYEHWWPSHAPDFHLLHLGLGGAF